MRQTSTRRRIFMCTTMYPAVRGLGWACEPQH